MVKTYRGIPVLTPEERKERNRIRSINYYYRNIEKRRAYYAKRYQERKGVVKFVKMSQDELDYIRLNYQTKMSAQEIADYIGCTTSAVYKAAKRLGVRKQKERTIKLDI